jgi:hypothetical protein
MLLHASMVRIVTLADRKRLLVVDMSIMDALPTAIPVERVRGSVKELISATSPASLLIRRNWL